MKPDKDLPFSAAEQGTKKLYLEKDYARLDCEAIVVALDDLGEGTYRLILDQSCFYPGGGGQDFDLGKLAWPTGKMSLTEVSKDKAGVVYHDGTIEGQLPEIGEKIHEIVDHDRRTENSRLHCAGHLIDYAVAKLNKKWNPGRGSHFPGKCYVEYDGEFNPEEAAELSKHIEAILAQLSSAGGAITSKIVPSKEAHLHSKYIPESILKSYQNVYIAQYPDNFEICCGGTHLQDVSQLGTVKITKIKKKNGNIRVSYEVISPIVNK